MILPRSKNGILGLALVPTIAGPFVFYAISGGHFPNREDVSVACVVLYIILASAIYIGLIFCVKRCESSDNEDTCRIDCINTFFILWTWVIILWIFCGV